MCAWCFSPERFLFKADAQSSLFIAGFANIKFQHMQFALMMCNALKGAPSLCGCMDDVV